MYVCVCVFVFVCARMLKMTYHAFKTLQKKNYCKHTEHLDDLSKTEVTVIGVATDFCVQFTAVDAKNVAKAEKVTLHNYFSAAVNKLEDKFAEKLKEKGVTFKP